MHRNVQRRHSLAGWPAGWDPLCRVTSPPGGLGAAPRAWKARSLSCARPIPVSVVGGGDKGVALVLPQGEAGLDDPSIMHMVTWPSPCPAWPLEPPGGSHGLRPVNTPCEAGSNGAPSPGQPGAWTRCPRHLRMLPTTGTRPDPEETGGIRILTERWEAAL